MVQLSRHDNPTISVREHPHAKSPPKICFNKCKYDQALLADPKAKRVCAELIPPCQLSVIVNLVRNALPEHARNTRALRKRDDVVRMKELKRIISGFLLAETVARRVGWHEKANGWKSNAAEFAEIVKQIRNDSRQKNLGSLTGRTLPLEGFYLVWLEDYIVSKIRRQVRTSELARIISAVLTGLNHYPPSGIDPDLLARKLKGFRRRNAPDIAYILERTRPDSQGNNETDLLLNKKLPGDRL